MGRTRPPTSGRLDARRLKRLGRRLALGEEVLAAADATTHGRRGVLAATNRRLLFVRRGALRRPDESFPYGELRGVRSAPGFLTVDLEQGRARSFSLPHADSASEIGAFAHARIDVTGSHVTRLLADLEATDTRSTSRRTRAAGARVRRRRPRAANRRGGRSRVAPQAPDRCRVRRRRRSDAHRLGRQSRPGLRTP